MKFKQCAIKLLFYAMCVEKNFSPLKSVTNDGGRNFGLPFRVVFSVGRILELSKDFEVLHGKHL